MGHSRNRKTVFYSQIWSKGTVAKWLEWLGYGAESHCKVMSLKAGLHDATTGKFSVNPAVKGYLFFYLFRIREG